MSARCGLSRASNPVTSLKDGTSLSSGNLEGNIFTAGKSVSSGSSEVLKARVECCGLPSPSMSVGLVRLVARLALRLRLSRREELPVCTTRFSLFMLREELVVISTCKGVGAEEELRTSIFGSKEATAEERGGGGDKEKGGEGLEEAAGGVKL